MTAKEKETKQYNAEIKKMADFAKKEVTKKEALRFLINTGISTSSGKLSKNYR
jgi:hypothetical protein